MSRQKPERIRVLRIRKGDTLKTIYARYRRSFTAADLQKYTEVEEGFAADELVAELRALDREAAEKRKRKGKK